VRDPEKLEKRDGLIPRTGDVYDTASLAGLIQGNDALISAFNPGWKDPNLYDDQVRGTKSIIEASRRRASSESSGWAEPAAWRSSRECG
jgi:putative NADH-flavin reductase